MLLPSGVIPDAPWWAPVEEFAALDGSPASEPVLAFQRELQDDALAALEDHVAGQTELYFVAFAPDGAGPVWRPRVEAARDAIDARYGEGRSVIYLNDETSLADTPFATVTHLREALQEIAAASDPDEDVAMVYVAGRSNADGTLVAELPPPFLTIIAGRGCKYNCNFCQPAEACWGRASITIRRSHAATVFIRPLLSLVRGTSP